MKKKLYSILLISMMLMFFSSPVFATTSATATSTLDLTDFANQFGFFTNANGFTWTNSSSSFGATAYSNTYTGVAAFQDPPTNSIYQAKITASDEWARGTATATATPSAFIITAFAKAGDLGVYDYPKASSSFSGSANWTYNGPGVLIDFSTPLSQTMTLNSDVPVSLALGSVNAYFSITSVFGIQNGIPNAQYGTTIINGTPLTQTYTDVRPAGELSVSYDGIYFRTGDSGIVTFGVDVKAQAFNPVPIPAAVWLLGSGLLGLVGIRRKLR
jgi:hypothetical protein